MPCSTCAGPRRRAMPTSASWRRRPRTCPARYGVFFAYVELEDFTAAYATIDALVADEPVWRYYRDDPTPPPQSRARLRRDDGGPGALLRQPARRGLGPHCVRLSDAAPANANTRLALYQVANARGWPRRAQEEAEIAASLAPRDVGSRIALVETAIDAYRFADAQRMVDELLALYPEDQGVRRLARDLDAKRRWLLDAKVQPSNSDGGGANASGRAILSEARLYSPPIADNWRAVRARRLFQRPSARGFRAAGPRRRRPRMAHPLADRDGLSDPVVGHAGQGRRRRHGRLVGDRPDRARRLGRAVLVDTPLRGAAVRHHCRRVSRPRRRTAGTNRAASPRASPICRSPTATSGSPAGSPTRSG